MTFDEFPDCTFTFDISDERADHFEQKFKLFNSTRASPMWQQRPQPPAPLHLYTLDESGALIAGLTGRTNQIPEWLEVVMIWVDEDRRGQGLGRQLMYLAEEEAKKRGCVYSRLATSEFQAPGFYRKVGYKEYGKLENCPHGETVYYFYKELAP